MAHCFGVKDGTWPVLAIRQYTNYQLCCCCLLLQCEVVGMAHCPGKRKERGWCWPYASLLSLQQLLLSAAAAWLPAV
jgi:hypothetical protein